MTGMFIYDHRMPYYANLAFMYLPFYIVGIYGKPYINKIVIKLKGKILINSVLSMGGVIGILMIYTFSDIPHTIAVVSFTKYAFLYWLSGFLGIISMFFLCICFNNKPIGIIQAISIGTLFIMCSHYEFLQRTTGNISDKFGDGVTFVAVILFFTLQCLIIPLVFKYLPILAGRGDYKVLHRVILSLFNCRRRSGLTRH